MSEQQCKCPTASMFPHRASHCALGGSRRSNTKNSQHSTTGTAQFEIGSVANDADLTGLCETATVFGDTSQSVISVNVSTEELEDAQQEVYNVQDAVRVKEEGDENRKCTCPTSRLFPHRAKSCALFKNDKEVTQTIPVVLSNEETGFDANDSEHTINSTDSNITVFTKVPRSVNGNQQCHCALAILFPHRVRKCALYTSIHKVENAVQETVQSVSRGLSNTFEDEYGSSSDVDEDDEVDIGALPQQQQQPQPGHLLTNNTLTSSNTQSINKEETHTSPAPMGNHLTGNRRRGRHSRNNSNGSGSAAGGNLNDDISAPLAALVLETEITRCAVAESGLSAGTTAIATAGGSVTGATAVGGSAFEDFDEEEERSYDECRL